MSKEKKNEINNKSLIKKIIISIIILIIVSIVVLTFPFLYFVGTMLYSMIIDLPSKPKEKHGEFPFELVYDYKGE